MPENEQHRALKLVTFAFLNGTKNVNPEEFFNMNLNNVRGHRKKLNNQQSVKLYFSQRVIYFVEFLA